MGRPTGPGSGAIDFRSVSREIRGLVARRRELLTMLGSYFAAMGILLENVLRGNLPGSLRALEEHFFAAYGLMLLVPSGLLALRLARLNAGMVLNGILYARLMTDQDFAPPGDMEAAARVNPTGVSFLMFILSALLAAFSASLLVFASGGGRLAGLGGGIALFAGLGGLYGSFHADAVRRAGRRASRGRPARFAREQWEGHLGASLRDANQDMTAVLGLCGLVVFSGLQSLSGLGAATAATDISSAGLALHGPRVFGLLMTATCLMGCATYLRLRVAAGRFSLALDPDDEPFAPLRLTDSLLGYALLCFLLALSLECVLFDVLAPGALLAAVGAAFCAAVGAEQAVLVWARRRR